MPVRVRFFQQSDAEDILRLYRSVGVWFEEVEVNTDFILSSAQRPDFRFMVAVDGGVVVGFLGSLYFENVGRAELGPLGVDAGSQGAGVGGALVESMLSFLSAKGVRRVIVKIKASNTGAQRFFLKQGFMYEAYLRDYTVKNEDVVQLARSL